MLKITPECEEWQLRWCKRWHSMYYLFIRDGNTGLKFKHTKVKFSLKWMTLFACNCSLENTKKNIKNQKGTKFKVYLLFYENYFIKIRLSLKL